MEQYLKAPAKRYVQQKIFSRIDKAKTFLGLAGSHPEKYLEVIPPANKVVLVDFNPVNVMVRRNSLIGEFDLLRMQEDCYTIVNVVDCDFCKSILTNGDDLLYIYNKLKKSLRKNKYISFTFSLRGVGIQKTLEWLSTNIPELNCGDRMFIEVRKDFGPYKYVKHISCTDLYMYRDSGDNMISGLIKI